MSPFVTVRRLSNTEILEADWLKTKSHRKVSGLFVYINPATIPVQHSHLNHILNSCLKFSITISRIHKCYRHFEFSFRSSIRRMLAHQILGIFVATSVSQAWCQCFSFKNSSTSPQAQFNLPEILSCGRFLHKMADKTDLNRAHFKYATRFHSWSFLWDILPRCPSWDSNDSLLTRYSEHAKTYNSRFQKTIDQLVVEIQKRREWIGVDWAEDSDGESEQGSSSREGKTVRLLDYACGTGLVTRVKTFTLSRRIL